MQVTIEPKIFDLYPDLQVVVAVVRDLDNTHAVREVGELQEQEIRTTQALFTEMSVSSHPVIRAWRQAYQTFSTASRYHSSVEALVTRVVKGKGVSHINTLVDLYNIASLKYLVPIGGEDLACVSGNIRLGIAHGDEAFVALGSDVNETPDAGEVIYADAKGCLCRRFNWREADRTKLTAATKHAIFSLEGLPPTNEIELKEAAAALTGWVTRYCGGRVEHFLLHAQRPTITFSFP